MATSTPSKAIALSATRPALPLSVNPGLLAIPAENYTVKYQTIVREGAEIIVGRVKVPTPEGHAFILRRYDTGAFSLTTMFKASFVGDTADAEKQEINWVKANYPTGGANGGSGTEVVRLAGTWIPASIAVQIAEAYNIVELVQALADANPDPTSTYRKSQRSNTAAVSTTASTLPAPAAKRSKTTLPTPDSTPTLAPPLPSTPPTAPSSSPSISFTPVSSGSVPPKSLFAFSPSVDVKQSAAEIESREIQAEAEIEAQKRLVAEIMPRKRLSTVVAADSVPQQAEVLATITTTTVTTTTEGEEPVTETTVSVSSSPSVSNFESIGSDSPLQLGAPIIPSSPASPSQTRFPSFVSPSTKRRTFKRERSPSVEIIEDPSSPVVVESSSLSVVESAEDGEEELELEEGRKIATNRRALAAEARARERAGPMQTFKQAVWGAAVFGVGMGVTTILPRFFF